MNRDQMSRDEFAAQISLPVALRDAASFCPETFQSWREAVINHYFNDNGTHRGINSRMKNRKHLEAAYSALKAAYFAVMDRACGVAA